MHRLSRSHKKGFTFLLVCIAGLQLFSEERLEIKSFTPAPYSHLNLKGNNDALQFALMGDHTGGGDPELWRQGLDLINQLNPEFVVPVGDLIAGKRDNELDRKDPSYKASYHALWDDFDQRTSRLQMPFFYTAGNHDYWNTEQAEVWQERCGPSYYSFEYKDVLFVILNTAFIMKDNSDPKGHHFDNGEYEQQLYWLADTLKKHNDVSWTFIIQHHPFWEGFARVSDQKAMWKEMDRVLLEDDRPYTVFAGHVHRYTYREHFGRDYITLSTSGADNEGPIETGNFNHVMLVTMKNGKPEIRNMLYDGQVLDKKAAPFITSDKILTQGVEKLALNPRKPPTPPRHNNPSILIPNSSFESAGFGEESYPAGWHLYNNEFTRSNEEANTGSWSLKLQTEKETRPVIHQVNLVKGAAYTLSASIKIAPGSKGRVIIDTSDEFDKTAEFTCLATDSGSWKKFSGTFTNASLDRMFIRCFAVGFSGTCYFDDIALTQISGELSQFNDAAFIAQTVPESMTAGYPSRVTVKMKNKGVAIWSDLGKYGLKNIAPGSWGNNDIRLVNCVVQGIEYTFTFEIIAPTVPGSYAFQWQMQEDGTSFGDLSQKVEIKVLPVPTAED